MRKFIYPLLFLPLLFALSSCTEKHSFAEREILFNSGWKFTRADVPGAEEHGFDDSAWRTVDLPHDWSIEDLPPKEGVKQTGPFSEESEGGISTGHVVGGRGWYRKHFKTAPSDEGKIIRVLFDGVYMDSDVWINGVHLGNHPYGYTAFSYDLTDHLFPSGENNVLAVRVNNEGQNSRWYSGSGIYRNVTLIRTNPLHAGLWGTFITTPEVSRDKAVVHIETKVVNSGSLQEEFIARVDLLNPAGEIIASTEKRGNVEPGDHVFVYQETDVEFPRLWCTHKPVLYTAVVTIEQEGKVTDQTENTFGIRSIEFSPEKGFLLNGESTLLKGGCMHHDNGPLGAAAFDRAEYRRVEIMKKNGFNAIRTAHNPPSSAFMDACDRLGMLVINEAFDHWQVPKNEMDYHRFFDEWWETDLASMVLRDRNRPSVIIWSIGNEIKERADSNGLAIAGMLRDKVMKMDATRPVTQGVSEFWETPGRPWDDTAPVFAQLDVHGYNYMWQKYESDHEIYPERIMIGTESLPSEALENWQMAEKHPYVVGDFVWTGWDYFGESGIGSHWLDDDDKPFLPPWPWFNANCGDISVLGYKKPQMYFRDVVWRNSPLEMMVHAPVPEGRTLIVSKWGWPDEHKSWNWEGHEGTPLQVSVYTRCQQVRLELNGQVIGIKDVSEDTGLTARFEVPWQPGELVATGMDDGKEVAREVLRTTGPPHGLRIMPERDTVKAAPGELIWFNVEVVDRNGLLVPGAEIPVMFTIEGPAKLQAVGNGNPTGMKSFRQPLVKTYGGRCQLIVRPGKRSGEISVLAKSPGISSGTGKVVIL